MVDLESENEAKDNVLTGSEVYNLLVAEGFSTKPSLLDPNYMFIIDCRKKCKYNEGHLVGAKHHSCLQNEYGCLITYPMRLKSYDLILIHDDEDNVVGNSLKDKNLFYFESRNSYKSFISRYPFLKTTSNQDTQERIHTWPSEIEENKLYIGTAEHANDGALLGEMGITHVVNVTLEQGICDAIKKKNSLRVPLQDESTSNLLVWLDKTTDFISSAFKSKSTNRVLVHCYMGRSRSSTVVLAYLMKEKRHNLQEACNLLKDCRPTAKPNVGFLEQLVRYEVQVFGRKISDVGDLPF